MMNRRTFIKRALLGAGALYLWPWQSWMPVWGSERAYKRLVVLGDPHLPVRVEKHPDKAKRQAIVAAKLRAIADINSWPDVDSIAVVGDIVARYSIPSEYDFIRQYFSSVKVPLYVIDGNHDILYEDEPNENGKLVKGDAESRRRKLQHFCEFWQLSKPYYSLELGGCHLIFLATEGPLPTQIGAEQFAWLKNDLTEHPQSTLIFFHGPLMGTLLNYNNSVNKKSTVAQPVNELHDLLMSNPQVRLWISGHTHTPATNDSFAAPEINMYGSRIMNIHNSDMDSKHIWTNSLYIYGDHIDIRTFDHRSQDWIENYDRQIRLDD